MLVSYGIDEQDGVHLVGRAGFFAEASDPAGNCLPFGTESAQSVRVDFDDDILLSCNVPTPDVGSFKTFCEAGGSGDLSKYQIAQQFANWESVGIFGNAQIEYMKDWVNVINTTLSMDTGVWDN